MTSPQATRIFYGWWIVAAAFLNLFFVVGIIFYGFPVFYPAFIESLGFTRSQVTQGFFLGMLAIGYQAGCWLARLSTALAHAGSFSLEWASSASL